MFEDHLKGGGTLHCENYKIGHIITLVSKIRWFSFVDVQENDSTLARKQTPVAS